MRRRELFTSYLPQGGLCGLSNHKAPIYGLVLLKFWSPEVDTSFCPWFCSRDRCCRVPGSSFFAEPVTNLIRFHFAKRDKTLCGCGERLKCGCGSAANNLPHAKGIVSPPKTRNRVLTGDGRVVAATKCENNTANRH